MDPPPLHQFHNSEVALRAYIPLTKSYSFTFEFIIFHTFSECFKAALNMPVFSYMQCDFNKCPK